MRPRSVSTLTPTRGCRLYRDDDETLRRQIKYGKYKDMSEAIREAVNTNLTSLRLKTFRNDHAHEEVKLAQREVIEPIRVSIDKIENNTDKLFDEINLLKDVLRSYVTHENPKTDDHNRIAELLQQLEKQTNLNTNLLKELRIQNFIQQGLMTFFAVGYEAGKIKPPSLMKENTFLKLLNEATAQTIEEAERLLEENPKAKNEQRLMGNFAQDIFNKLHT